MPERRDEDGAIAVRRIDGDYILADVTTGGKMDSLIMSPYNAWRLFGILSLILEIPLPARIAKAIRMGDGPGSMTWSRDVPAGAPLGDRVAAALAHQATVEALKREGFKVSESPDGTTAVVTPPTNAKGARHGRS